MSSQQPQPPSQPDSPDTDRTQISTVLQDAPPRHDLEQLYWIDGKTQGEIAEEYDTYQERVSTWMSALGIPTRPALASADDTPLPADLSITSSDSRYLLPDETSADLSTIQRDILVSIARLSSTDGPGPSGSEIRKELNGSGRHNDRSKPVIYTNLQQLTDQGYVDVVDHPENGRVNIYSITPRGWAIIDDDVDWLIQQLTGEWRNNPALPNEDGDLDTYP